MAKKKLRGKVTVKVYGSLKEGLDIRIDSQGLNFNEEDLFMLGAAVGATVMHVIEERG